MEKEHIFFKNRKKYLVLSVILTFDLGIACLTWGVREVVLFLKFLGCKSNIIQAFESNRIVGLHFFVLSNDLLRKDLKIKSVSTRLSLLCVFKDIKHNDGIFNPQSRLVHPLQKVFKTGIVGSAFGSIHQNLDLETKLKNVKDKMINRLGGKLPEGFSAEQFDDYCSNLIDKKSLIENYLNKDFRGIRRLLDQLPKNKGRKFGLISASSPTMSLPVEGEDVFDLPEDVVEVVSTEEKKTPYSQIQRRNSISVKLVITEISQGDNKRRLFRQVISPIMFGLNRQQEFGIFHASLIVGPWYLEWNNSSLCIPRKCYSKAAVFAADLTRLYKGKIDDIVDKVSEVVVEWNATKVYEQYKCNCQHFVDDVLSNLGITIPYEGPMGVFLNQLRTQGKCQMEWRPSLECRRRFKFLKKSYKFRTHQEIDQIFLRIQKEEPLWTEKTDIKQDCNLVKAFDRAFWLRWYAEEKSEYKPLKDCPFDDPCKSSMVREWF